MKIILNESEQASYHKIIQGLFEDSTGGSIDPNLASNEQNTGPSQEPLQPEEQELLIQLKPNNKFLYCSKQKYQTYFLYLDTNNLVQRTILNN